MVALEQALQALWEPSRFTYTVNGMGEGAGGGVGGPPAGDSWAPAASARRL